jgi:hypothetical protein
MKGEPMPTKIKKSLSINFAAGFGGAIALALLVLYTGTTAIIALNVILCAGKQSCTVPVTDGTVFVFTTVGGLISALVVAALAMTTPGNNPSEHLQEFGLGPDLEKTASLLVVIYLVVWMLTGVTALVVGVMLFPAANKTLSDAGTTWLGLSVAAGYAYFGIRPTDGGLKKEDVKKGGK